jgi:hypothetical protein
MSPMQASCLRNHKKSPGTLRSGALFRGASENAADNVYMLSIITWPKPEQLTWVAPSIRRAKS